MNDIIDLIPKRYRDCQFENIPKDIKDKLSGLKEKGLYIWGGCGSGKTYVCYSVFKEGKTRGMNIMVRNFPLMLNQIKGKDNLNDEVRDIANYEGILIIDDIGAEKMSEWVAETLYIIINTRYENCSPTIFISNLSLQKLEEVVGDRIPSRISEMCEVIKLDGKDKRLT